MNHTESGSHITDKESGTRHDQRRDRAYRRVSNAHDQWMIDQDVGSRTRAQAQLAVAHNGAVWEGKQRGSA